MGKLKVELGATSGDWPSLLSVFWRCPSCQMGVAFPAPTTLGALVECPSCRSQFEWVLKPRRGNLSSFLCPECGKRFRSIEKALIHKLEAHQRGGG